MYIKQIRGTYGIFKNETMVFNNGLNIISKDNEWGKTTLISLIKTMFYGLNTAKRDKKDYLSDKSKYTDNGNFSGEMVVSVDDEDIVIVRSKNGRSSSFSAYFNETGLNAPYPSGDLGKLMLSLSEDAFSNSALIEFDNRLISNSKELESLIVSMTTTGDTTSNFAKAMKNLKALRSSLDKSSGERNQKEAQLEELNLNLKKLEFLQNDLISLNSEKDGLAELVNQKNAEYDKKFREISVLKLEEEQRANIIKAQSDAILTDLEKDFYDISLINDAEVAYKTFEETKQNEYQSRLKLEQIKLESTKKKDEILAEIDAQKAQAAKVHMRKIPFIFAIIFGIMTVSSMVIDIFPTEFLTYETPAFSILTILALLFSFKKNKVTVDTESYQNLLDDLDLSINKAENIQKNYAKNIEHLMQDLTEKCTKINITNMFEITQIPAQISHLKDINKRYFVASQFKENTKNDSDIYRLDKIIALEKELNMLKIETNQINTNYTDLLSEIAKTSGKIDEIPPINQLNHKKSELLDSLNIINSKINAIDIASDALEQANTNLTARLSPEISKKASEYLAFLTENKYETVILQKELEAFCKTSDDFSLLDKLRLSSGTKEQLYFALRLAICEVLISKKIPIILDDPFVFYDDKRMKKALDLLMILAKERQILLLTCHTREENYIINM